MYINVYIYICIYVYVYVYMYVLYIYIYIYAYIYAYIYMHIYMCEHFPAYPPTPICVCQYVYFCTSKASTHVQILPEAHL